MSGQLGPFLLPAAEEGLRARFGLSDEPLRLITSGWHKLAVISPARVFTFPRGPDRVAMVEREAEVLATLVLDGAPQLLGLHRDEVIWPFPFLELGRVPGRSWDAVDTVEAPLPFADVACCLAQLARRTARWHEVSTPSDLASRPAWLDPPRVVDDWTRAELLAATAERAAELLSPYLDDPRPGVWARGLAAVASLDHATVHGELSDGQFLLDDEMGLTGVVDWDGLHVGHPLLDLDFGVGMYRVHYDKDRFTELRRCMWAAYAAERGRVLPEWAQVNLFWYLLDATTLLGQRDHELWPAVLDGLGVATAELE